MMKRLFLSVLFFMLCLSRADAVTSDIASFLNQQKELYQKKYFFENVHKKMVDNRGEGVKELYGTRNFRVVLPGVLYRGGANNKYLKQPRANMNPLPYEALENLCQESFSASVYLYSENYNTAPKSVFCKNKKGLNHTLEYKQYAAAGENEKILSLIYQRIKGEIDGPIYVHCWNGWHSSGLIAGMALKQFCGWNEEQLDSYWVRNTDGHEKGHDKIRERLRKFKPYPKLFITKQEQSSICPDFQGYF